MTRYMYGSDDRGFAQFFKVLEYRSEIEQQAALAYLRAKLCISDSRLWDDLLASRKLLNSAAAQVTVRDEWVELPNISTFSFPAFSGSYGVRGDHHRFVDIQVEIPLDLWFRPVFGRCSCRECGNYLTQADNIAHPYWCITCYRISRVCSGCENRYLPSESGRPDLYENCNHCTEYHLCEDCGEYFDGHDDQCSGCRVSHATRILGYHDTQGMPLIFHSLAKDTPRQKRDMFGMELEVAFPEESVAETLTNELHAAVPNFLTRFTPTSDSSIGGDGHGVEFVSAPQTYQAWVAFADTLNEATEWLRAHGCRSFHARSCGAHIHVSRMSLASGDHLVRLYELLASSGPTLRRLSSRGVDDWDAYSATLPEATDSTRRYLRESFQTGYSDRVSWRQDTRYLCLNLNNPATIEFRGWRGTLRAETLLEQIDCTRAMLDFTREERSRYNSTNRFASLRRWMADQNDTYERALRLVSRRLPELTPAPKASLKMRVSRRPNTSLVTTEA